MNVFAQIVLVLVAIAVLWIWSATAFNGDDAERENSIDDSINYDAFNPLSD